MEKKIVLHALRAIAAVAVLLGASTVTAPAQPAPALTTVRFTSSASDDLRPILYAQSAGLFKKAGLNVVVDKASSGGVVAQSIIGGAMDIGKASMSSLVAAYARGVPFVLIAPSAIHRKEESNSGVMLMANSPIKSVLDLQGKIVGCTAIGDIGYLGLREMIDAQGGDSSKVKWVEIPTSSLAATVDAGRVDAGLTTEPYMSKDLATGKFRITGQPQRQPQSRTRQGRSLVCMVPGICSSSFEGFTCHLDPLLRKLRESTPSVFDISRSLKLYAPNASNYQGVKSCFHAWLACRTLLSDVITASLTHGANMS
jgi:ABC-type phosphate/phosphonate transport system substrate-binding protein